MAEIGRASCRERAQALQATRIGGQFFGGHRRRQCRRAQQQFGQRQGQGIACVELDQPAGELLQASAEGAARPGAERFAQALQFRQPRQRFAGGRLDLQQHPVARPGLQREIVLVHRGDEGDATGHQRVATILDVEVAGHAAEQHQLMHVVEVHERFAGRRLGILADPLDAHRRARRQFDGFADGAIEMGERHGGIVSHWVVGASRGLAPPCALTSPRRHSGEGRNPVTPAFWADERRWIPAFAGMTVGRVVGAWTWRVTPLHPLALKGGHASVVPSTRSR